MARRVITLDEKIKTAETAVATAKTKYDAALDELESLSRKRNNRMIRRFWKPIMPEIKRQMKSLHLFSLLTKARNKPCQTYMKILGI